MILNIVLFATGFLLLYYGASWLVKGSSSLARNLGLKAGKRIFKPCTESRSETPGYRLDGRCIRDFST
ncbi:MAG: hypothetical protein JRJ34_07745 [Deltaproteobacteria bacterium]|nr:hypothetical protein [Deltaproteobacteria bacterium]